MSFLEVIELYIISLLFIYPIDEMLFYREVKKHCNKYKGTCEVCDCFSCPKQEYMYKELLRKKNLYEKDYGEGK